MPSGVMLIQRRPRNRCLELFELGAGDLAHARTLDLELPYHQPFGYHDGEELVLGVHRPGAHVELWRAGEHTRVDIEVGEGHTDACWDAPRARAVLKLGEAMVVLERGRPRQVGEVSQGARLCAGGGRVMVISSEASYELTEGYPCLRSRAGMLRHPLGRLAGGPAANAALPAGAPGLGPRRTGVDRSAPRPGADGVVRAAPIRGRVRRERRQALDAARSSRSRRAVQPP